MEEIVRDVFLLMVAGTALGSVLVGFVILTGKRRQP